jgi:hypothetical protein
MTRRPILWIVLAVLAVVSATFSWGYFARAFPLLSIDIRMDRQAALARARALALDRHLGPPDFRDAASFSLDETVQTFVELEGGGKAVFAALVKDSLLAPYGWHVRHFKEREKREVTFFFAPDGTPNGFTEELDEAAPGAALPVEPARHIAESAAAGEWSVDLAPFELVEHSQEERPGKRVDHTFVYERPDRRVGEGRYRLRLVVSGDRLTSVTYFLKVPEAFTRRYQQMRSANTAIGVGSALAFVVVYVVGGIVIGLFFLTRERWVIWRQPVLWGALVALAQTAATVNEWPLAWMQYDTAVSTRLFVATQVAQAVAAFVVNAVLFSFSFMAAESLTRRAFPDHPQFWRLWGRNAGGSRAVLGRTALGYLLVPIFVAYDVALYFFATKALGWWTPSEALFTPDVLASYAPWFSAVAKSFQAGFWEESLFRAVPIAGAALIGDRLGHRRLWIVAAFIVQAVIFGAGHAPYPTQPAYARPVELMLPAIGFGLLYLMFGLLPGIILHFTFDAFWFAMPLFATTAAGVRVQQILVVTAILVPLWVTVARRARAGRWIDLSAAEFNGAWRAAPAVPREQARQIAPSRARLTPASVRAIVIVGAAAATVWAAAVVMRPLQHHSIRTTRTDASNAARAALAGAHLGPAWRFLPVSDEGGGTTHRFVWNTAGRANYTSLLGTYLQLPGWTVYVRTFQGDVAERAETWTVHLDSNGAVQRINHELPEARPGPALDEATARSRARRALSERFGIAAASLKDVSAEPSKLPARTDWTLAFADSSRSLPRGELRLSADIVGDELTGLGRYVFVPEDWERSKRSAQTVAAVVRIGGGLLAAVIALGGVIAAIISWSRRQFSVRLFLAILGSLLLLNGVRFVNGFPASMASFSTSQPLQLQLTILVGTSAVAFTLVSAALALVSGAVSVWSPSGRVESRTAITLGIALGVIGAAVQTLGATLGSDAPVWPSYAGATAMMPSLVMALSSLSTLLARTAFLLLLVAAADRLTEGWTRRRAIAGVLLVIVGGLLGGAGSPQSLMPWVAFTTLAGVLLAAGYVVALRHDVRIAPIAAAVMTMAGTLHEGAARAYPGALGGAIIAAVAMAAVAYAWFRVLTRPHEVKTAEEVVA